MDIKPHPQNSKKHTNPQVELIARSIQRFGWQQPIKVGLDGVIIVGHGRWMAWEKYGKEYALKDPWIVDKDGKTISGGPETRQLTPEEEIAYRHADNKINDLTGFDLQLAVPELKGLSSELFDITGYSRDIIIDQSAEDDVIPENPPAIAQIGDVWALGRHRLLVGDATDSEAVARLIGAGQADLVFTDPPYNVDYTGKTKDALKIQNDKKGNDEFLVFLTKALTNMASASKKGAAIYVCHADSEGLNFRQAFITAGYLLKQCIIWNKNSMVMGRQDYHWKHEPILYGWREGASHKFYGEHNQTTVWDMKRPSRSSEHPTMKPVELILKAIANSSKEGDSVLDLFGGSGSTLIACEKSGRNGYIMELDPHYADVIIKRYEDFTKLKAQKL